MTEQRTRFANLPIDQIKVGPNVRVELRDVEELAQSIAERGVLQPLTVVPTEDGHAVELLIGHRRLAAAKLAGLDIVPCILRPRDAETVRLLDQLAENLQRSEMTVLEKAKAYRALYDQGLTYLQIGARVQQSDFWVKRTMSLLEQPECVQQAAHRGIIPATKAIDIPRAMFDVDGAEERLASFLEHQGKNGLHLWYQGEYRRQQEAAKRPRQDTPAGFERFDRQTNEPFRETETGALATKSETARLEPGLWKVTLLLDADLRAPVLKAAADAGLSVGEWFVAAVEQLLDGPA